MKGAKFWGVLLCLLAVIAIQPQAVAPAADHVGLILIQPAEIYRQDAPSGGAYPIASQDGPPSVMAGTKLRIEFMTEVGTGTSHIDDGVQVRLIKSVEAEGREVLPSGTVLSGRVISVRKGDRHTKSFPMIRLGFNRATLPNGRSFPLQASLADLGVTEYVDSEGAASTRQPDKGGDIGVPVATGAAGAGIGAIGGGAKGAGIGAGVGAGVGVLADLAAHSAQWGDFKLKRGRKAWLRLDADLLLAAPERANPPKAQDSPQ